jgi:hypothetical protein
MQPLGQQRQQKRVFVSGFVLRVVMAVVSGCWPNPARERWRGGLSTTM